MNFTAARTNMIKQQLQSWGVNDPAVLSVFAKTKREDFVPEALKDQAYADFTIPLPFAQVMFTPKQVAKMLQALNISPNDSALEIGTGTGYTTALLSQLCESVTSIDINKAFIDEAAIKLKTAGLDNITLLHQDATTPFGDPDQSYDIILISGALLEPPEVFIQKLTIHGRLLAIIGQPPAMEATLFTKKSKSTVLAQSLFDINAPALKNTNSTEKFIF